MLDFNHILKNIDADIHSIAQKVFLNQRISIEEGLKLYNVQDLSLLGILADYVKKRLHGNRVYFNKNFHIEPTNICIYHCKFCSYRRSANEPDAWVHSITDIQKMVETYKGSDVTEVHIVGGVHPNWDLNYFCKMLTTIRDILPNIHIKAFSAIELDYMIRKAGLDIQTGLKMLRDAGLQSIPGGGAEIFDDDIRSKICGDKSSTEVWLNIHRAAHQIGMTSNATILYGHIENYEHRLKHLDTLRQLQDETEGFNAFIPLKFRRMNNLLSDIGEVSVIEDLKNYAVSRIFLDNIPHLKAYWPMIGKDTSLLALSFGADDMDGTINDSTKIYTMAGVEDQKPTMTTNEIVSLIRGIGMEPIERNSTYKPIRVY